MTTYLPKAGMSAIRYNGPSTPNHDTMLGWYYENLAKPPPAGRKRCVVLCPQLGGFTGSAPITHCSPRLPMDWEDPIPWRAAAARCSASARAPLATAGRTPLGALPREDPRLIRPYP